MIIKRVKIQNFLSHENTEIEFHPGITLITGLNGAGKTSILEAISFALFKEHTRGTIDDLIKHGRRFMRVEVDIINEGKYYRIFRERRGNQIDAGLYEIDEKGNIINRITRKDQQVSEEIGKILGIDKSLFINSIFIRQGEIDALVKETPAKRKALISKLLQIDNFENAWNRMREIIHEFEIKVEKLKTKIDLEGEIKNKIEQLSKEIESSNKELEEKTKKLGAISKELEEAEKEKNELDKKQVKYTELSKKIEHYEDLLERDRKLIEENEKKLKEIENKEKRLHELEWVQEFQNNLNRAKDLRNRLDVLDTKLKGINEKVDEFKKMEKEYEETKDHFELFEDIERKIQLLEREKDEFSEVRGILRTTSDEIKKLREKRKQIEDKENEFMKKAAELGLKGETIYDFKKSLREKLDEIERFIENLSNSIEENKSELDSLEGKRSEVNDMFNKIKHARDRCPLCGSRLTPEHHYELVDRYSNELRKIDSKIKVIRGKLNELEKEHAKTKKLKELYDTTFPEREIDLLISEKEETIKRLTEYEKKLPELQDKLKDLLKIEKEIERLKKEKEKVEPMYKKYIAAKGYIETHNIDELLGKKTKLEEERRVLNFKLNQLLNKMGIGIEEIDSKLDEVNELVKEYNELKGAISQKSDIENTLRSLKSEEEKHTSDLLRLREEVKALGYDEEKHASIKKKIESLISEKSGLQEEVAALKQKIKDMKKELEENQEKLKDIEKSKKRLQKLEKYLLFLKEVRDFYGKDGIQAIIRSISLPLIEENARDIFQTFNLSFSDIKLDQDYNITLYGPGFEQSISGISGGERIAVALALRLAIAKTLAGQTMEMLMLDEPTIHLDAERREELIDVLRKLSVIPQVIIVSHDEELKEIADTLIQVEKIEDTSVVSITRGKEGS